MKFLARGHRSIVYLGKYKNKIIAIKKRREDIDVSNHLLNEAKILKIINKHKIGPKMYYGDQDMIAMEYIKGSRILEWIDKNRKNKVKLRKIAREILRQCRILDKLHIEKQEMHKPVKHIIIGKKIVMIDFERAKMKKNPGNVTQVCQFLANIGLMKRDIKLLKSYKKKQSEKNFSALKKMIF